MFFEVHRGLTGLGAMTVYRTAAQTAADIEQFGKEAGPIATQGGLFNQQAVFKYAASQGRLHDLQAELDTLQTKVAGLQRDLEGKVNELQRLGVTKAGDYAKMAAKMVMSKAIPIVGWMSTAQMFGSLIGINLDFLDIFGDAKKKKKKAEALMRACEELLVQIQYWSSRMHMLQIEGETLANAVSQGPGGIDVKLIGLEQQTVRSGPKVDLLMDITKGPTDVSQQVQAYKTMKQIDAPESRMYGTTIFKTAEELSSRVNLTPTGDRLPVGFQTIYSPVLENGKMVAKVPQIRTSLPGPVDRRVIYGGLLSGPTDAVDENKDFFCGITMVVAVAAIFYGLTTMKR